MAKKTSGPSGDAKTYEERVGAGLRRIEAWVPSAVWTQFEALAERHGSKKAAVIAAVRAGYREIRTTRGKR